MAASDSFIPGYYPESDAARHRGGWLGARRVFWCCLGIAERLGDFLACALGVVCTHELDLMLHASQQAIYSWRAVFAVSVMIGAGAVILLEGNGAYRTVDSMLRIRETEHAVRVSLQMMLLFILFGVVPQIGISIGVLVCAGLITTGFLIAEKQITVCVLHALHANWVGVDQVVICGKGEASSRLALELKRNPRLGMWPIARLVDHAGAEIDGLVETANPCSREVPVRCGAITPALLRSYSCSILILADDEAIGGNAERLRAAARDAGMKVAVFSGAPNKGELLSENLEIEGFRVLSLDAPLEATWYAMGKRLADIVLSTALLIVLAPALIAIAVLIQLDSPGPALFRQTRVGKGGALFKMWKFRSMYANVPSYECSPHTAQDRRITRVGRILRKTSLDELPQLINVFLGQMSLVGPRPEMPFIVERYSQEQRQRLQVTPGITGLWQLSACRSEAIHRNLHYDLFYIRKRTLSMDLAILLHTLLFAMRGV